jgi:hypothetical protein
LRAIMEATGLSKTSASLIRSGRRVPPPRHWPALARLQARDEQPGNSPEDGCSKPRLANQERYGIGCSGP